jgi:hypothetical protein
MARMTIDERVHALEIRRAANEGKYLGYEEEVTINRIVRRAKKLSLFRLADGSSRVAVLGKTTEQNLLLDDRNLMETDGMGTMIYLSKETMGELRTRTLERYGVDILDLGWQSAPWEAEAERFAQTMRRFAEYVAGGVIPPQEALAVSDQLEKWASRYPRGLTENEVDMAALGRIYGFGDCGGGIGCVWQYGQAAGPLWEGPTKVRNSRSVSFRVGNRVRYDAYREVGTVLTITPGVWSSLGVRLDGGALVNWPHEGCSLI